VKNISDYVLPVTSAAMTQPKATFCKVGSTFLDKTPPSEHGTTPTKAEFGYLTETLSKMASFIYCLNKAWESP